MDCLLSSFSSWPPTPSPVRFSAPSGVPKITYYLEGVSKQARTSAIALPINEIKKLHLGNDQAEEHNVAEDPDHKHLWPILTFMLQNSSVLHFDPK